jgi:DNA replication protein DnaC
MDEKRENCRYNEYCNEDCAGCLRPAGILRLLKFSKLPEAQWNPDDNLLDMPKDAQDRKAYEKLNEIKTDIEEFVEDGGQLYICSSQVGNGKTTWAIKLLVAYLDRKSFWLSDKPRGIFINVSDYLYRAKDYSSPLEKGYRDSLIDCDLLVLDDIAIAGLTDHDFMNLYGIIEMRLIAKKSTIFTGNCVDPEIMEDILGTRLTSRIWNTSQRIEFCGDDRRSSL